MSTRRGLHPLALALFLLVALLLVSFASAGPIEEKRTGSKASASISITTPSYDGVAATLSSSSIHSSSASLQTTSASSSKHTNSVTSSDAASTGEVRIAAASSSGPLATFCDDFVKQCYRTALDGRTGEVTVTHACRRNGNPFSTSFSFSCTSNGRRVTAAVLKAMGQAYHRPSATTTIDNVSVVTRLVEDVATATRTTTRATTVTDATSVSTRWTNVVDVETRTVPSTISSTTVIPYTLRLTSEATSTEISTITSTTSTTVTQTEVLIGTGEIPIYYTTTEESVGPQRRAPSTFCLAYKIACAGECAQVSSRVAKWLCQSELPNYTLTCECRNGKRETQNALEAVAEDRKIRSVTEKGISTQYLTSSRTTTIVTEAVSTQLTTLVTSVDKTSTISTATSTTTIGETTWHTGISSAVKTTVTTTYPTTTTSSTTTTVPIMTTTRLVLASTGRVSGFDSTTGGYLGSIVRIGSQAIAYLDPGPAGPSLEFVEFMAVRDSPTGLYQLTDMNRPSYSLVQYANPLDPVFRGGVPAEGLLNFGLSVSCGTAGTGAGPPDPSSTAPCEAFILSPIALDPTPGSTLNTVSLRPFYINPLGSTPANHSGVWGRHQKYGWVGSIGHIADRAAFTSAYPNDVMAYFTMRFPF